MAETKKGSPGPLLGTSWWLFPVGLVTMVASSIDATAHNLVLGCRAGLALLGYLIMQIGLWRAELRWLTLLPAVHFLEQAFAGADFSTEKFSAALSLISAALFQCPKVAKFSVAHFLKLLCDLRCSFSIAKSRKILRCSSSDI